MCVGAEHDVHPVPTELGIVQANLIAGPGVTIQLFGQSEGNHWLRESGI
jgi:hypothetical protein